MTALFFVLVFVDVVLAFNDVSFVVDDVVGKVNRLDMCRPPFTEGFADWFV